MVARIITGKNMLKPLNYNEKKLQQGTAEILAAAGFFKKPEKLKFHEKLKRFKNLTSLNQRTQTNCLHVSLNFDPAEKLTNEKMEAIAREYMERIGFGGQPYLVYRHNDSGHPHLHIVSTNIKSTGERISMHRLGANQSEKARKEIEIAFGLVKADSKKNMLVSKPVPVNASKVIYGKSETRRAISNVLRVVLSEYKFSSLPELNAVLQLYNVNAERGDKGSRIYEKGGLVFRVLDEKGNRVGTPIKASLFYMKPTLKMLEKKFEENAKLKEPLKRKLQTSIGWVLHKGPNDLDAFAKLLREEGVSLVVRKGKENVVFGMTYIDHKNKVVFNGSDLGKQYSAKAVMEGFHINSIVQAKEENLHYSKAEIIEQLQEDIKEGGWEIGPLMPEAKMPYEPIPYSMKIKRKKKKRRGMRL